MLLVSSPCPRGLGKPHSAAPHRCALYRSCGCPSSLLLLMTSPTFPECSETSSLYARCLCFCEVKPEHSLKVFLDPFEMTTIKSYFRKHRYVIPIHTNANANAGTIFENTKWSKYRRRHLIPLLRIVVLPAQIQNFSIHHNRAGKAMSFWMTSGARRLKKRQNKHTKISWGKSIKRPRALSCNEISTTECGPMKRSRKCGFRC